MQAIQTDSAPPPHSEPEPSDPAREVLRLRAEVVQAQRKGEHYAQQLAEQKEYVARLFQENKSLLAEMEHLRSLLGHKDQLLGELRQAPAALLTELAQLRLVHEEASARLQRACGERDAAQAELARRAVAYEQAEQELRRLSHQHEHLQRLTVSQHDAGEELTRVLQDKAALADALRHSRERQAQLEEHLDACLDSFENLTTALGIKVYALRAALGRRHALSADRAANGPLYAAFDQLLAHLDEGNGCLRELRKLIKR